MFIKVITSILIASINYYNKMSAYFSIGSTSGSGKLLKNIIDTVIQNKENKECFLEVKLANLSN